MYGLIYIRNSATMMMALIRSHFFWREAMLPRSMPRWCAIVFHLAISATSVVSYGAEVLVKNDSFQNGGAAVVVGDFVAGEQAGVVLQSPCDGAIVELQIGWLSDPPGAAATIERAIHVYAFNPATYPAPGAELLFLDSPLMTPGNLNLFRFVDENGTIPINIPVTTGQKFFVTLHFDNPTHILQGTASVFRDTNGCQAGKNVIRAVPGGWFDLCGVTSGDFVIRAVVNCGEPSGACCMTDGSCDEMTATDCSAAGGTYKGNGTLCSQQNCPQPVEACCFEATNGCLDLTAADCMNAGGVPGGAGTTCGTFECFPRGACCLPNGSCLDDLSPEECSGVGGSFQGNDTTCALTNCPAPKGACCFSTGFCLFLTEDQCNTAGADWMGLGTDCTDGDQSGKADDCEIGAPNCPGDLDNDMDVDVTDIAILLSGYSTCTGNPNFVPSADFDHSGCIDIADLSQQLALYGVICQ